MPFIIFEFVVLLFSAVIHEVSHGFVAEWLGDPTARNAGRLTMNPIVHLDLFGSVLMPVSLYILSGGQFFFAAAKPVPFNPGNLKDPKWGSAMIGAAGPGANVLIAIIFGIIAQVGIAAGLLSATLAAFFDVIIYINILLAVFNLVPIPPLDGSRVLFALLPTNESTFRFMRFMERYGLVLVLFFVFFGFSIIIPIINSLYSLIAGGGVLPGF